MENLIYKKASKQQDGSYSFEYNKLDDKGNEVFGETHNITIDELNGEIKKIQSRIVEYGEDAKSAITKEKDLGVKRGNNYKDYLAILQNELNEALALG